MTLTDRRGHAQWLGAVAKWRGAHATSAAGEGGRGAVARGQVIVH